MNKKVIFGTALFIVVGLFMFTFANPNDKVSKDKSSKQTVTSVSEEKTSTEEPKKEETKKEEVVNNQTTTTTTARRTTRRTITTPVTNPVTTPVVPQTPAQEVTNTEEPKEDPAVIAQKEAEEKAKKEAEELANYKEAAKKELAEYKKDENYSDKNTEAVATIKTDGSDAIDAAKTKDEVDQEKEAAKALIDALDTEAPVLTIADDEVVYQKLGKANLNNYTVTDNVSSKDKIVVTISVTKDGRKVNEVNYNSVGTYAVSYTATDEAGNVATAVRNIKVKEVKAIELVLMAGEENVTNATDSYWVNDPAKTISVYVKYNNGLTKKLSKMNCNTVLFFCIGDYIETGILSTAHETFGTATVTYSYKGLTAKYNYNVKAKKVISLAVTGNKAEYFQNEAFGITVTAKWNDGSEEVVTNYKITGNTKKVGNNQTALISYGGFAESFKYNVKARVVTNIQIIGEKTTYFQNEPLSFTLKATWNDGTIEENVTNYSLIGDTKKVQNNQTAYVTYANRTVKFKYNVIARQITSLVVTLNKDTYIAGQKLDIKSVVAKWNDNTEEVVNGYTVNANTNKVGNQTGYVTYQGIKGEFSYNVIPRKVVSLEVTGNKATYIQNEAFGITVTAKWNDNTEEVVTNYSINNNTKIVKNHQTAVVSYGGATTSFTYDVIARRITSLQVTLNKDTYVKGQKIDIKSVVAKWNDGSEETITKYTVTGNTNVVANNQKGYVIYNGIKGEFRYNVIEKKVVSISVTSPSNDYIKGDKFNITVKAKWNDGSEEVVNDYRVSGNTNTVGLGQTATISYKGLTATYTYDVKYELHLVHPWFSTDYYLEFKDNVTVTSIVYYNKNGGHSAVPLTRMQGKKIYINPTIYAFLQNMDGTKSNERLVVTINENGKQVSYTYKKAITD